MTDYFFFYGIQLLNGIADEANTCPLAKPPEIDVAILKAIMASNQPRQHSRIRCAGTFANQRDLESGFWLLAHLLDNGHVAMAATDQN